MDLGHGGLPTDEGVIYRSDSQEGQEARALMLSSQTGDRFPDRLSSKTPK